MTNYIIIIIMSLSVIVAIADNKINVLSNALLDSGNIAVQTVISLIGPMALWGGVMKVAQASGLTEKICRFVRMPVKFLFPKLNEKSKAFEAICMNITANMLGLGNAATPLGITAMKELNYIGSSRSNMATLVVLNTASIQLVPITVATLRQANGSDNPWDFIPAVLVVSLVSLVSGCIMVKILRFKEK